MIKTKQLRGVWGHSPPENFEILKCHFCVLRGQLLFEMFTKLIVIFMLIFYSCGFVYNYTSTRFYSIFCADFEVLCISVSVNILCYVILYKYCKNSFGNIRTHVKIGIFPILITYWLGFWIFQQNWENPDKIGMVG